MSEELGAQPSAEARPSEDAGAATAKARAANTEKKQKIKARSAWISFYSRIIAQFVGSAATIALGLLVLHRYKTFDSDPSESGAPRPAIAQTAQLRERPHAHGLAVAVLPLDNYSGDARQDALANGLTDALIMALSQVDGLRVVSRTSAAHYKRLGKPLPEVARELSVDWIVEGSLVSANGRVRVVGQLIDAPADEHVWAAAYDRRIDQVLSLQASLADTIAHDLGAAIVRRRDRQAASASDDRRVQDAVEGGDADTKDDPRQQPGRGLPPSARELSSALPRP